MQNEYGNALFPANAMNSGTAGITRSGANDVQRLIAFRQYVFEQIAQKLQGNILKGQCYAMKQLENIDAILPDQRRDLGVGKTCIRALDQAFQVAGRNIIDIARYNFK